MRVAIIGRTHFLLNTAKKIVGSGHKISFIYTCKSDSYYKAHEKDYRIFAKKNKIPYFCDNKINQKYNLLKKYKSEIGFSMNYKSIINKNIVSLFKYGILNSHPGDLPKYKGNACPNWAILNFEKKVGLTIHSMSDDLDSGPIFCKIFKKIGSDTYIGDIYDWMDKKIPTLFLNVLKKIKQKKFSLKKQVGSSIRTFPRIKNDDKINWYSDTKNILALIRSCSTPFDGAFTFLFNEKSKIKKKIRIFKAKKFIPKFKFYAVPGQVCLIFKGNPVIATKNGMIEILECSHVLKNNRACKLIINKSLRNRLI